MHGHLGTTATPVAQCRPRKCESTTARAPVQGERTKDVWSVLGDESSKLRGKRALKSTASDALSVPAKR
jgi:hypothetical protein